MRSMLAGVTETIGDEETAWTFERLGSSRTRAKAMNEACRRASPPLQHRRSCGVIGRLLRRCSSLSWIPLAPRATRSSWPTHYCAARWCGDSNGELAAARADLEGARLHTTRIAHASTREQYDGRLLWVEGLAAPSPGAALAPFTRAIAFHQDRGRRMFLPSILYDRARTHLALGDRRSAAADLDAAIGELDATRESLPAGERRWGVFHAAEDIFDAALDLALEDGDNMRAFQYADHARARTLLDELKSSGPLSLAAIPAGFVILEYEVTSSRLITFVASRDGLRVASHPLDRQSLRLDVAALQEAIESGEDAASRTTARRLYQLLIEPSEQWITANATLVIVPDAILAAVPFAALLDGADQYVIESHAVTASPSASIFLNPTTDRPGPPHRLLMVSGGELEGR